MQGFLKDFIIDKFWVTKYYFNPSITKTDKTINTLAWLPSSCKNWVKPNIKNV